MSEDQLRKVGVHQTEEVVTCSEGGGEKRHSKVPTSGADKASDNYSMDKCFETNYSQLVHASDLAESKSNQKKT